MARSEKTDRAAWTFEWLRSLNSAIANELARKLKKGDGRALRPLDLCVAVSLTSWLDTDLTCFRSQAAIAGDVGCSEKSAAASVARLLDAGFLLVPPVKKTTKGGFGGRPATTYRAMIPAADGTSEVEVSGTTFQEKGPDAKEVSGSTVREVSGSTVPTNPLREPLERTPVKNTPPTPREAGGANVPDQDDGFAEKQDAVGEVVPFPSRRSPAASPDEGIELPKRSERKSRHTLAGPLCPGCHSLEDEAEIFRREYPIRENRGLILRKWKAARREATFEEIMDGLEAYKARTDNPRDRGFRVTPDKWLDAHKWADEPRETPRGIETTCDRLRRIGVTGADGYAAIHGPRKAPAITFEDLEVRGR